MALAFNVGNEASQPECEAMPRVVALQMSAPRDFDIVDVGTTSWAPPRAAPGEKPRGIPHSTIRLFARNDPMTTSTRWPRLTAWVGFEKAIQ